MNIPACSARLARARPVSMAAPMSPTAADLADSRAAARPRRPLLRRQGRRSSDRMRSGAGVPPLRATRIAAANGTVTETTPKAQHQGEQGQAEAPWSQYRSPRTAAAVGRESHEGPDVSAVGEVPDAVDAGQAKPEAEHPAEQSRHPRHGWPRRPRHWVVSANACSGHLLLRLGQVLPPVSRPQSVARWTPLCHFLLLEKRAALPRPRFARPLLR